MVDIQFTGGKGVFTVRGCTKRGLAWLAKNIAFEPWQGTPRDGIAIEGAGRAMDIAAGADIAGLQVGVPSR